MFKLTRLNLLGFKSFYTRTEIEFPGGITAVVGPNGCGKSNISDAISWVLGEQSSKSLRGSKMEDVIFNGSERRGPLPMAEVALTLAWVGSNGNSKGNGHGRKVEPIESETFHPRPEVFAAAMAAPEIGSDTGTLAATAGEGAPPDEPGQAGDEDSLEAPAQAKPSRPPFVLPTEIGAEISVTRRLYRSGESEYRIDDRRVRLRDVQDLMQAAGIGTGTYSVIEQDRISALLSARPKERKEMIEEAAGILGIKGRRRAAMLKLDHTETNLSRLRDLVAEVTRQVNSLKRQAAKARRYRRNTEEIRHQRRLLFALDHNLLAERLGSLEEDLRRLREDESRLAADASRHDAAVAGLRQRIDEDGQDAGTRRDELHAGERDLERLDGDTRALAERLREATEMSARCARQAEDLRRRAAESLAAAEKREGERTHAALEVQSLETKVVATEEAYTARLARADEAAREAEAERSGLLATVSRLGEARNRGHKLEERGHRLGKQRQRLEREMEECRRELEEDQERLVAVAGELAGSNRTVIEAEEECRRHTVEMEEASARSQEAREALATARRQVESCEERAAALGALWHAAHEDESSVADGVALGDGIEVQGDWEDAAGAWGESLLQARVVPDVAAALAAVARAREHGEGRVRLAVSELMGRRAMAPGRLSSVLKGNEERAALLAAALQDPVLVKDLDAAVQGWRQVPGRPYLTREGDGITAAGIVVGGSRGEGARLLACNRQRREAGEEAASLREALPAMEATSTAAEASLVTASRLAEERRGDLERIRHDLVEQKTLHERFLEATSRHLRRRDVLQEEETILAGEEGDQRRETAQAVAAAQEADARRRAAEEVVQDSQQRLDALRREIHTLAGERTEERATAAARREALAALAQEVERLRCEVTEFLEGAGADEEESRTRQHTATTLEEEIAILAGRRQDMVARVVALRERCRADEMSLQESRGALSEVEQASRQARNLLDTARDATRQRELDMARAETDSDHMVQECRDEFGCLPAELASGLSDEDRQVHAESVREEMTRLEGIRERMGQVNMVAIDQFGEEEERQVYLLSQQEDMEASIRSLRATIQKIDRTSRERFLIALEAIRADFTLIFQELFGGGVADIELQEPDNVLESGIEIIAQPPGKRTRNINLLSGGEKALSAIALLFAIFKYRPSPFCLLDEADAALDEANVERFARLLKSYSGETQFILITHNRTSMEVADRMYGVTMEEPGISQTVSLELS